MVPRRQWLSPRISVLDQIVRRFQDRWELDHRFRAMLSGVAGLVMIVAICSCMGIVTTVANTVLANVNSGNVNGSHNPNTGTGLIHGQPTFPTATVPPWPQSSTPAYSIIPSSKTPVPAPTHAPTATPRPEPTQGGGGGNPTTCNGGTSRSTWALTPCPQIHGQSGTLTISSPAHPNADLNIILNFGCSDPGCTLLYTPGQYKLDAQGNATISYTVPDAAANSNTPISGYVNIAGGPTLTISAAPVQ